MVTLWMASLFVFAACHDDDDDDDKGYTPGKSVVAAFEAKFPNAVAVSWEKKGEYEKAEFHQNGQEVDTDGSAHTYKWYRRDKDGNAMDSGGVFATGKSIAIDGDDVDVKTTFICEVT